MLVSVSSSGSCLTLFSAGMWVLVQTTFVAEGDN